MEPASPLSFYLAEEGNFDPCLLFFPLFSFSLSPPPPPFFRGEKIFLSISSPFAMFPFLVRVGIAFPFLLPPPTSMLAFSPGPPLAPGPRAVSFSTLYRRPTPPPPFPAPPVTKYQVPFDGDSFFSIFPLPEAKHALSSPHPPPQV